MASRRYLRRLHFIPRVRITRKWKVFRVELVENRGFLRGGHARVSLRFFGIEAGYDSLRNFKALKRSAGLGRPPLKQLGVNNTYNHYGSCTQKEMRLLKICSLVLMNAHGVMLLYSRLVFEMTHRISA